MFRRWCEWRECKLGEIATKIGSGATPRGGSNSYKEAGISLIRSQNILDFKFSNDGLAFIDNQQADELKNVAVEKNDVLLNITGDSVSRCCIVPNSILPARVNQHVAIIRLNPKKAIYLFIFYFLQFKKEELLSYSEIGGTRRALTKGMIEDFDVSLPDLPEQKAIAAVLSSLDDKIDLLHRQNLTLEAMAETLFRQWFIEEAGEDWEEVTLEDVTSRITDGAHASPPTVEFGRPMASVKDMYEWGIYTESCRQISQEDFDELVRTDCRPLKNDILIAKDGSYLKHVFVAENDMDVVILSSIAILRPNGRYHPLLLATFLKLNSTRESMENIVTGAVIPRIVLKNFRKYKLLLPPKQHQNHALTFIEPLYKKCWENCRQIRTLEKLRDTLLPKLMSGEVRVKIA
ncbi:MAG: restriction endonuclease subunit S [Gammaproteobacteria bacterium]|nr:restriction endonuclease subunit S [Gammaproteobacteria bacterium]